MPRWKISHDDVVENFDGYCIFLFCFIFNIIMSSITVLKSILTPKSDGIHIFWKSSCENSHIISLLDMSRVSEKHLFSSLSFN